MTSEDPIIRRLMDRIDSLEARLDRIQNNSVRAEVAGAFARVNFADLPAAGIPGRVFWVLDVESGMLFLDDGAQWVPIGGSFIVFAVGDNGSFSNPGVTLTGITDTPTVNPGWATSDTVPMTQPNLYIKVYVDGNAYTVPGWLT
jgi:hypothetical protein